MRRGVESAGYNMFISGPSADVTVRSRRLRKRYGVGLDIFLDRWKDVKGRPLRAIEYARFLFSLGRNEELRALVSSIEKKYNVDRNTIYCSRAEDWLELVGPSDLYPMVKGTGCHNTRANIALRLARMGDHGAARSIAYELLDEFKEEEWEKFEGVIYFVPMTVAETLHPLAKALVQIGDVEAARQLTDRWRNYRRHGNGLDLLLIETGQMDEAAKELEIRLASQDFDGREYLFPAFEFYRLGKWERMAEMLSEKKMQIPFDKAIQIYEDALEKGKAEETYIHLEKTLGLKDAYLLHYINLTREMRAGDEQAARKTMSYLIEKEKLRPAPLAAAHYLGLLRLSVAMDDKELSLELVRLILDKILTDEAGLSGVFDKARARRHILAETAAIYAQLLH